MRQAVIASPVIDQHLAHIADPHGFDEAEEHVVRADLDDPVDGQSNATAASVSSGAPVASVLQLPTAKRVSGECPVSPAKIGERSSCTPVSVLTQRTPFALNA